jgi:hypothetical protein
MTSSRYGPNMLGAKYVLQWKKTIRGYGNRAKL